MRGLWGICVCMLMHGMWVGVIARVWGCAACKASVCVCAYTTFMDAYDHPCACRCAALAAHSNASLWLLRFPEAGQGARLLEVNFARRCSGFGHQLVLSDLLPMARHLSVMALATRC